jgi:membrane AbrB-like protein
MMFVALRGLAIGALGGTICWFLGVPAPWLAGSMALAIAAIFGGVRIDLPDWLKAMSFIFLGMQTGTSVTWATVERAGHWPLSILFLAATVIAVTWASSRFYRQVSGWDGPTALFASLPGALSLVLLLASETGADMRRVSVAQSIRLFFLVAALPTLISGMSPSAAHVLQPAATIDWRFLAVAAGALAASLLLERWRVPAGLMLGAILVAAAAELSGFIAGSAPAIFLVPANVVLGVMIASRFNAFSFAEFRQALGQGFAGFLVALGVASVGALTVSLVTGLAFPLTLLAYSPGGLDAMTIMAFALNLDPAYVGAHQIARYAGLALTMPWITGYLVRRMSADPAAKAESIGSPVD